MATGLLDEATAAEVWVGRCVASRDWNGPPTINVRQFAHGVGAFPGFLASRVDFGGNRHPDDTHDEIDCRCPGSCKLSPLACDGFHPAASSCRPEIQAPSTKQTPPSFSIQDVSSPSNKRPNTAVNNDSIHRIKLDPVAPVVIACPFC